MSTPSYPCDPAFLITIDTEGDNLWSRPRHITTENAKYLPRFQSLCEKYSLRPTYVVNHEMAECPVFREFATDMLARNAGEIGMHLHAWNSPPLEPLTSDDMAHQPFLTDYGAAIMRDKIHALTDSLEEKFNVSMVSHRAGRWAFNATYARILAARGYLVDCSVTPLLSWRKTLGAPQGKGGTDYRGFRANPYRLDLQDIAKVGDSNLLEVPMTILPVPGRGVVRVGKAIKTLPGKFTTRIADRLFPEVQWLRPNGRNLKDLLRVVDQLERESRVHAEFMLHSSELMPGGSPRFSTTHQIETLFEHLEALFIRAARYFCGKTLAEFRAAFLPASNTVSPQGALPS